MIKMRIQNVKKICSHFLMVTPRHFLETNNNFKTVTKMV